jgi:hypothetical protein
MLLNLVIWSFLIVFAPLALGLVWHQTAAIVKGMRRSDSLSLRPGPSQPPDRFVTVQVAGQRVYARRRAQPARDVSAHTDVLTGLNHVIRLSPSPGTNYPKGLAGEGLAWRQGNRRRSCN